MSPAVREEGAWALPSEKLAAFVERYWVVVRLGLSATWSVIVSFFRRLLGGSKPQHA